MAEELKLCLASRFLLPLVNHIHTLSCSLFLYDSTFFASSLLLAGQVKAANMNSTTLSFPSTCDLSPEAWNELFETDDPFGVLSLPLIPEISSTPAPAPGELSQPLPAPAPLPAPPLKFSSLSAAENAAFNRRKLNPHDDDLAEVERNPHMYIHFLMAAFSALPTHLQDGTTLSATEQLRWNTFQHDHAEKVSKKIAEDGDRKELAAWLVFGAVLDVHKKGVKNAKTSSLLLPKTSDHLFQVTTVIAEYAIIRWDVIRYERIEDLVTSPRDVVRRKITNFNGNQNKKTRDEDNVKAAAQSGFTIQRVLGTTRPATAPKDTNKKKRKRASNFPDASPISQATASPGSVMSPMSPPEIPAPKKQKTINISSDSAPVSANVSPGGMLSSTPETGMSAQKTADASSDSEKVSATASSVEMPSSTPATEVSAPEIDIFDRIPEEFREGCTFQWDADGMSKVAGLEMFEDWDEAD